MSTDYEYHLSKHDQFEGLLLASEADPGEQYGSAEGRQGNRFWIRFRRCGCAGRPPDFSFFAELRQAVSGITFKHWLAHGFTSLP
jgi:hypothetical protein